MSGLLLVQGVVGVAPSARGAEPTPPPIPAASAAQPSPSPVEYGYDTFGRLDTITDWANRITDVDYDAAGRVDEVTRPGNLLAEFTYDELNRPTAVAHSRNGTPLLTLGYSYDANGNLASFTDDTGTATFGYDDLDRLTSAAYPGSQDYGYVYDAVGNLTSATTPAGTTTYTYDLADRITSTGPGGAPSSDSATRGPTTNTGGWTALGNASASDDSYATAAPAKNATINGRVGGFDFGAIPANATIEQVTVTVEWKVSTSASVATLGSQLYVNNVARGSELINSAEPTSDTTQTYTVAGLTRADLLNSLEINVRATRGNSNTAVTASLDAVSIEVAYTVPGGSAPTYDDNGNLLTDGSYGNRTYSYDALGRLTGVAGNGTTATYTLDGAGNRTAETLNGVTTGFDLDLSVPEPTILSDGTRTYLPGDPGAGYQEAGVWWSALTDQIGSPLSYVNVAGATTTAVHYDPYGAPRPGSADPGGIGYAGEWKNPTGLVNLRARAYDPLVGRFTGRDTFGGVASAPQTANRYSYALNNPLRYTDPSGHFVQAFQDNPRLALSTTLQLFPGLGDGYSGLTGVLGFDPIAGVALADWERGLAFAAMLPWVPGLGGLRNADELGRAEWLARAGEPYGMGPTRAMGELGGGGGRLADEVVEAGGDAARASPRGARGPAFADTDLLVRAERGHVAALAEIRRGPTLVAPNQFNEFLAGGASRRAFLEREGIEVLSAKAARTLASTPSFRQAFDSIVAAQGRADAALAAFAKASGLEAVTMDGSLVNFIQMTLRDHSIPITRIPL